MSWFCGFVVLVGCVFVVFVCLLALVCVLPLCLLVLWVSCWWSTCSAAVNPKVHNKRQQTHSFLIPSDGTLSESFSPFSAEAEWRSG